MSRIRALLQRMLWPVGTCSHEWEYCGDGTGYFERCRKCGEIVQA
jgi:hypothetical protein